MLSITSISILRDNYVWTLSGDGNCLIIDPGEARPVDEYITENSLNLTAILVTHRHWDHTDGIEALVAKYNCPVFGPVGVQRITRQCQEGDNVSLLPGLSLDTMEIPGHTEEHIAYYTLSNHPDGPMLFCGDTLFSAGCGRLLGGTADQLKRSLDTIKKLPPETLIYCTHEYTLSNIAFAEAVMPKNKYVKDRKKQAQSLRSKGLATVPVRLHDECQYNPFLRCNDPEVIASIEHEFGIIAHDELTVFQQLRAWKDRF